MLCKFLHIFSSLPPKAPIFVNPTVQGLEEFIDFACAFVVLFILFAFFVFWWIHNFNINRWIENKVI